MRKLTQAIATLTHLPDWLNWLLSVVEPLIVLGITVALAYTVWCLMGPDVGGRQARAITLLKDINEN